MSDDFDDDDKFEQEHEYDSQPGEVCPHCGEVHSESEAESNEQFAASIAKSVIMGCNFAPNRNAAVCCVVEILMCYLMDHLNVEADSMEKLKVRHAEDIAMLKDALDEVEPEALAISLVYVGMKERMALAAARLAKMKAEQDADPDNLLDFDASKAKVN